MKRGWLSLLIVLAMIVVFWTSPGVYGFVLWGVFALLAGSLPALCLTWLARLVVPRRAWRLLLVPLLCAFAYFWLTLHVAGTLPPKYLASHAQQGFGWFTALAGLVCGGVVVILTELALGTPERFLRTSHDQHP